MFSFPLAVTLRCNPLVGNVKGSAVSPPSPQSILIPFHDLLIRLVNSKQQIPLLDYTFYLTIKSLQGQNTAYTFSFSFFFVSSILALDSCHMNKPPSNVMIRKGHVFALPG